MTERGDRASDVERTDGTPGERRRHDRRRSDRSRSTVRVAVVGDFHCGEQDTGVYRPLFARVNEDADVLLLAGDLTNWGTASEMRVAMGELAEVTVPIVAVLGNHDHEAGQLDEVCAVMRERGVHLLDGDAYLLNEKVGIAGVKGFMGGFGRRTLTAFGESQIKTFVDSSIDEVKKLELALRRLHTPVRIALLHYSPVIDTIIGEPEQIYPFLGTDRLAEPLDRYEATVAFHGHAHHGTFRGQTAGGVPVFNVCHALIKKEGVGEMYFVYEIPVPMEAVESDEPMTSEFAAG